MVSFSCSIMSNSLWPMGCSPTGGPWDFPGKNTGVSWQFLFQGIFSIHGLNLCLLLWGNPHRWIFFTTEPPKNPLAPTKFSSVQSFSHVWLLVNPWTAACQASLSITNTQSLLKLTSIVSVILSNHLILCHPLLSPSIFPSIKVVSNESVLHIKWPKYWSFSFNTSPPNEYSGVISFRIDWLDLLAV